MRPQAANAALPGLVSSRLDDSVLCSRPPAACCEAPWSSTTSSSVHLTQQQHLCRAVADRHATLLCACRNGQPLILTAQHRVYGFGDHVLEEIERVEAAGGWIVDGRVCNILAVSRAFGDPEFKVGEGWAGGCSSR